jgi:1-acyl-sn-glycerol-3-phosphate acyltransferase
MNKMYAVLYPILWFFMKLFHPWSVSGRENIPEGGVLLCGNHSTLGDPIYVVCAVGRKPQLHILAKEELMNVPVIGFILKHAGIIGIKRGKADVGAIKESLRVLKNGEKLLLFPEGTRVKEGQTGQAHTGAALFATRAHVPIVPIYISPKKRWFRKTEVIFGQPYEPEYEGRKPTPEDYQRIADDLMVRIRALGEGR